MAEIKNKFLGEAGAVKLVQNIKDNFSPIDHTHTAEEIGADTAGSAAAALTLAKQHTDEQIATITAGDVIVKEAEHSSTADKATSADEATKATQDASGNVITETYETKTDASAKLDEAKTYTKEYVDGAIGSIEFPDVPEQVQADYMESDEESKAFIKNRPGYKKINPDLYSKIETLSVGNYCLVDFNIMLGNYTNYLTYADLSKDYNRDYDFYVNYVLVDRPMQKRIGKSIKDLDGTNCYLNIYTHPDAYTQLYIIHDRELLSDDLKAKILNNGIWLIITGDETEVSTTLSNLEFIEYVYTKFDENLLPKTAVFQRDLVEYVSEDKLNESITDLENELTSYTDEQIASHKHSFDNLEGFPSDMDGLALVTELGFVDPAQNNGSILTDNNGAIYTI